MIFIILMFDLGFERLEVVVLEFFIGVFLLEWVYFEVGVVNQLLDMVGVLLYGWVWSFDFIDESFECD